MNTYCDANALVKVYMVMPERGAAEAFLHKAEEGGVWPVPVTDLIRLEVTNAIERMVFESRTSRQWRATPEMAMLAHAEFEADLSDGRSYQRIQLTLTDIERESDSLVRRHTAKHGFRTYDIIHVASALKLKCRRFLSFDKRANALAKLAGLKTL